MNSAQAEEILAPPAVSPRSPRIAAGRSFSLVGQGTGASEKGKMIGDEIEEGLCSFRHRLAPLRFPTSSVSRGRSGRQRPRLFFSSATSSPFFPDSIYLPPTKLRPISGEYRR